MAVFAKGEERKAFFFEKKKQKTFVLFACITAGTGYRTSGLASSAGRDSGAKVFCFFSSEKKAFLSTLPSPQPAQ